MSRIAMNIPNTMKMKAASLRKSRRSPAAVWARAGAAARGAAAGTDVLLIGRPLKRWPRRSVVLDLGLRGLRAEAEQGQQSRPRLAFVARMDRGDDGEAWPQLAALERFGVERDANRHALHNLGEIAGRIVGRQQRELRAGGGRERDDRSLNHTAVQ